MTNEPNSADKHIAALVPRRRKNNLPITDLRKYISSYGLKQAKIAHETLQLWRNPFEFELSNYRSMRARLETSLAKAQDTLAKMPPAFVGELAQVKVDVEDGISQCVAKLHEIDLAIERTEARIVDLTPTP